MTKKISRTRKLKHASQSITFARDIDGVWHSCGKRGNGRVNTFCGRRLMKTTEFGWNGDGWVGIVRMLDGEPDRCPECFG